MHEPVTFWIGGVVAALLVGLAKGGLPVVGMLAVPVWALWIPPVQAAGLLLPVFVVSDIFGVWAYRRAFDRRNLAILIPAGALGVALGWALATVVPERAVTALVGAIGLSFALTLLLRRGPPSAPRHARIGPGLLWGTIMGFTSFVSHAGGPPYQVYVLPQRLEKMVFAGTTTLVFAAVNAMKLLPYWALGQLSGQALHVALLLMAPACCAVFAGVRLVRVLPERRFFQAVTWALLAVSLKLLWDALRG